MSRTEQEEMAYLTERQATLLKISRKRPTIGRAELEAVEDRINELEHGDRDRAERRENLKNQIRKTGLEFAGALAGGAVLWGIVLAEMIIQAG